MAGAVVGLFVRPSGPAARLRIERALRDDRRAWLAEDLDVELRADLAELRPHHASASDLPSRQP